jgi:hypothetical protein
MTNEGKHNLYKHLSIPSTKSVQDNIRKPSLWHTTKSPATQDQCQLAPFTHQILSLVFKTIRNTSQEKFKEI